MPGPAPPWLRGACLVRRGRVSDQRSAGRTAAPRSLRASAAPRLRTDGAHLRVSAALWRAGALYASMPALAQTPGGHRPAGRLSETVSERG
jgi:hypothetical protein